MLIFTIKSYYQLCAAKVAYTLSACQLKLLPQRKQYFDDAALEYNAEGTGDFCVSI